ncbi:non-ribosomal peptide synthetase [Nocardia sp. BMG111209]|uniref:non-ribosomal peptide synthetase n=1 Tax=Nocardia sp. BMG111209 TaxID=1160137 RepID=UPI0003731574|nr:non-ribosomal peptide synthetase [Nocardia sp. BMG111209]
MTDLQGRIAALSPQQRALLEQRVAELARTRGPAPEERIAPRDPGEPAPLAFQQEREWAIAQFRPANNIPGAFRVDGDLDPELFGRVLTEVSDRHEVLRSTVELRADGTRVQVTHPLTPVPAPVVDLSACTPAQQRAEVLQRWTIEVLQPFDPKQPQRLRTTILRMGARDHVVLITTDHTAADLVSMAILVREVATLYALRRNGSRDELPPLEVQYADFAAWQREFHAKRVTEEVEHWRGILDGVSGVLTLPSDRPYPARPMFAGAAHVVDLSSESSTAIRTFIEREKASPVVVFLAALSVLLYRYLGRADLVIGEIVSGRSRAQLEPLIGCFVTALPLRVQVSDDMTLREVVAAAQNTVLTAYDHQDLPIERLIDELNLGREASQTSLSHMWLDVRTPESELAIPGLRIAPEPIEVTMSAAPLTLDADPNRDRIRLQWVHMTEMFDTETVVVLADQFERVLRQLVTDPQRTVGATELAVAAPAVTVETAGDTPTFVELFQRRVAVAPHAPAVIRDGVATGYLELNAEANRLAHRLREYGVGAETRVGILVGRSVRLPIAIVAVLKAGGVYVPLDPGYPPERIAYMLGDAGARVLIAEDELAAALTEAGVALPDTVLPPAAPEHSAENLTGTPDPAWAAYVVYTSGSTGRPKGTVIEHRSLAVFARDAVDRLRLGSGDRFLQFASAGFDVLVEELFPTWLAGGAVVIPAQHIISGGVDLADLVERERLTVMELPTAYWHEWVRQLDRAERVLPEHLRLVIIGGERVLPDRVTAWRRQRVPLLHVYGLTETTVSSTFFRLDPADPVHDWPNLPIGTPLPSADLRILDNRLRPVPTGATGELYIGGVSLARGYAGRPGLTAHRFVADPDPARPGRRLYRTGDLVRRRPDGNLEFHARADTQIKIRGFRVEPTEIESTLGRHPEIAESVVTLFEPAPGDRRLIAYVVARPGAAPTTAALRGHLERELPPYMVPAAFVPMDALPLNANGKVDRAKLPLPAEIRVEAGEEYVAPRTPVEQQLAEIVAAVVGLGEVGVHDNFFEIGGDSILAIQVVARAQESNLRLSPYDLFERPTIAALAEVASTQPLIDADQGDVTGPVPLAPVQRAFCLARPQRPQRWNTAMLLELPDPVEPGTVRAAVERLLGHHDGLRQRFLLAGERTRVRIAQRGDRTPFTAHDLTEFDDAAQDSRMAELTEELRSDLDLAVGPMLRVGLFRLGRRPDRLLLIVHRLVADSTSLRILRGDLAMLLAAGADAALPAKSTSWQSWIRRLVAHTGSDEIQGQRAYWTELVTAPAGELPRDLPAGNRAADTGGTVRVSVAAGPLRAACEALAGRADELLLTALSRTLSGWTGADRHLVDIENYERPTIFEDVDLGRTIGLLSSTHPVALTGTPDAPPETTLKQVKEALRAVPSAGIGWQLLRRDRDAVPAPVIELGFDWLEETVVAKGTAVPPVPDESGISVYRPYPIAVQAISSADELVVHWYYDERRFRRETVERLAERHLAELGALIDLRDGPAAARTPSDFPLARVDQSQLDNLLGRF